MGSEGVVQHVAVRSPLHLPDPDRAPKQVDLAVTRTDQPVDPGDHPGLFERPQRRSDRVAMAPRRFRERIVGGKNPAIVWMVEAVQQRPQKLERGSGHWAPMLARLFEPRV